MKNKIFTLIILFSFFSCNQQSIQNKPIEKPMSNNNSETISKKNSEIILENIDKAPISNFPIGVKDLDNITFYDCSKDVDNTYNYNPVIYKLPIEYNVDTLNKYKLNTFLDVIETDNLLLNVRTNGLQSSTIYLSKRLPAIDGINILLCSIKEDYEDSIYYSWGLILFSRDGKIKDSMRVGQIREGDGCFQYALFSINKDYKIHIKYFSYCEYGEETYKAENVANQIYTVDAENESFILQEEIKL